ncbi:MAG: hypothetical protein AAGF54_04280 [Pseudomonadota bacterium]
MNQADNAKSGEEEKAYFGKLEHISLQPLSIVLIRDNTVKGYILIEASFSVDSDKKKKLSVPIELIAQNAINSSILNDKKIDIERLDEFNIDEFQNRLKSYVNKKLDKMVVHDVLIQRIDFIKSNNVRSSSSYK